MEATKTKFAQLYRDVLWSLSEGETRASLYDQAEDRLRKKFSNDQVNEIIEAFHEFNVGLSRLMEKELKPKRDEFFLLIERVTVGLQLLSRELGQAEQ